MLRLLLVATESVFTASTVRTRGLGMKVISSLEQSKSQPSFTNSITCIQRKVSRENFVLPLFL
jgi:ABC-type proline/glycine betaine transport system permease subunit